MNLYKVYLRQMGGIDNVYMIGPSALSVELQAQRQYHLSTIIKVVFISKVSSGTSGPAAIVDSSAYLR